MSQGVLIKNMTSAVCAFGLFFSGVGYNSTTPVSSTSTISPTQILSSLESYSNNTRGRSLLTVNRSHYYKKTSDFAISIEAKELFGTMREATIEETEGVNRYIRSISRDTGVNFFELC